MYTKNNHSTISTTKLKSSALKLFPFRMGIGYTKRTVIHGSCSRQDSSSSNRISNYACLSAEYRVSLPKSSKEQNRAWWWRYACRHISNETLKWQCNSSCSIINIAIASHYFHVKDLFLRKTPGDRSFFVNFLCRVRKGFGS